MSDLVIFLNFSDKNWQKLTFFLRTVEIKKIHKSQPRFVLPTRFYNACTYFNFTLLQFQIILSFNITQVYLHPNDALFGIVPQFLKVGES